MNLRILKKTMWRLIQKIDAGQDPDGRKERHLEVLRGKWLYRCIRLGRTLEKEARRAR